MTPRAAYLLACALDVAVRKPGNVSVGSAGHGMDAALFVTSAEASAAALFEPGASVGARIEGAVAATCAAVGCNTNLGIVLLCAPIARAAENRMQPLRDAVAAVLDALTVDDARAAYRAIRLARPAGLGNAPQQDVNEAPSVTLREAMALAADRDSIARQYRDGYAELFDLALPSLPWGLDLGASDVVPAAAVQQLYLLLLSTRLDSHIVRKHGAAVAQRVMAAAQRWREQHPGPGAFDADPGYVAWDLALKAGAVNPGTSADLTVATLMLYALS